MVSESKYSLFGKFIAVALFALPFVFSRSLFYAGVNAKLFFILTVINICGLGVAFLMFQDKGPIKIPKFSIQNRPVTVAVCFFILSLLLSAAFGVYTTGSFFSDIIRGTGVLFICHIIFLSYLLAYFMGEKDWSLVRRSIVFSSALLAGFTILGVEGFGLLGRIGFINLSIEGLTFANTTFAGIYLLFSMIIGFWELIKTNMSLVSKYLISGSLFIIGLSPIFINGGLLNGSISLVNLFNNPLLVVGSARASSITLIFFLFWLLVLFLVRRFANRESHKISILISIFVGLTILITTSLLFVKDSFVQRWYIETSSAARIIVWESGLKAFAEKPIFGWGPENFRFAYERYFNNQLFLDQNQGEIWFDKAHNFQVDILVSVGLVGMLAYIALFVGFITVLYRAYNRNLVTDLEIYLLGMIPIWHFLQLQTGFDTVSSYVLGAVFLGYALYLEKQMSNGNQQYMLPGSLQKIAIVLLTIIIILSSYYLIFNEYNRQRAIVDIFRTENQEDQIRFIHQALNDSRDFESHRLIFNSFLKGVFSQIASLDENQQPLIMRQVVEQLDVYDLYFEEYLNRKPDDYRARINYAYLLINKAAFKGSNGDDLKRARSILEASDPLSPSNPITHVLLAVVNLYSGNMIEAQEYINYAVSLNPDIKFTNIMKVYIDRQIKNFPTISILKLENL